MPFVPYQYHIVKIYLSILSYVPAMNDQWTYHDSKNNPRILQHPLENILRLSSLHGVAVIPMSVYMGRETAVEDAYHRLCLYYRVPMLSYRAVVIDEVLQAYQMKEFNSTVHVNGTKYIPVNYTLRAPVLYCAVSRNELHPYFQTHVVIAQFVSDFLEKAYYFYAHSRSADLAQVDQRWYTGGKDDENNAIEMIKPLYDIDDGGDAVGDRMACHPITTLY
jgi:hypothetical protein